MLDLYSPGTSVLHRLPPAPKLLALMIGATVMFLNENLLLTAAAAMAVLALYLLAQLSLKQALAQLRPLVWVFAIFFVLQWVFSGLELAAYVVLRLAALILLAGLVTLTTRSSDMIDTLTRALRILKPIGANPAKIGLAISLAQKARGLERSVIAVAMPVAIRTLKMADDISDAIESRGYRP